MLETNPLQQNNPENPNQPCKILDATSNDKVHLSPKQKS